MSLVVLRLCLGLAVCLFHVTAAQDEKLVLPTNGTYASWTNLLENQYINQHSRNEPFQVRLGMALRHIVHVDLLTREVELTMWLRMKWLDRSLLYAVDGNESTNKWQSSSEYLLIDPENVWAPRDVMCVTCTTSELEDFRPSSLLVYDDRQAADAGYNVFWTRQGSIKTKCNFNLADFPFDSQACEFRLEAWEHNAAMMDLNVDYSMTELLEFDPRMTEYEVKFEVLNKRVAYAAVGSEWPSVIAVLHLRRRPQYYVSHAIVPMLYMCVTALCVYWLPLDSEQAGSGDRISLSVTLLLTIVAIMTFTSAMRPAIGEACWIDYFQLRCLVITASPLFETVLVYYLSRFERLKAKGIPQGVEMSCRLLSPILSSALAFHGWTSWHFRYIMEGAFTAMAMLLCIAVTLTVVILTTLVHMARDNYKRAGRVLEHTSSLEAEVKGSLDQACV
eukprot:TRINITY_DN40726_c0_g1_i1.p1 TRINITY_DN40726_c0_g1~~TRINITY_DN40726_c0_g1_i1.p1  ORF type:complete len:447 (-),score=41.08 TRINITY_DN40726_c0_g1_i1:166-1506(-)